MRILIMLGALTLTMACSETPRQPVNQGSGGTEPRDSMVGTPVGNDAAAPIPGNSQTNEATP